MAFKQRSSGLPFKEMGSSPAKQADPLDLGLIDEAKKVKVNKGLPKNFNTSGKDTWVKRSKEILNKGKKIGTKSLKVIGLLPSLMLTPMSASADDQPKFPKGDTHYQDPKKKIDFTSED